MRIARIEDLHCNAGWRECSFLKITTGGGRVGWSECMENFGAEGLTPSRATCLTGKSGDPVSITAPQPVMSASSAVCQERCWPPAGT